MEEIAFSFLDWLRDNICFCPIFIVCLNDYVRGSESKEQPSSKHKKHKHKKHKHKKHKHKKHKHKKAQATNVPIRKSGHSSSFSDALIAKINSLSRRSLMSYVRIVGIAVSVLLTTFIFWVQKTEINCYDCIINQPTIKQNLHPDDAAALTKMKL